MTRISPLIGWRAVVCVVNIIFTRWAPMNMFQNRWSTLIAVMGLFSILFVTGCGSSGGGGQAGVASVSVTDAPACGFDQVNVTVSKVRIHQSATAADTDAGWTDITLNPPRKINLLMLNDPTQANLALDSLGEVPLAAGHYTQLRLVLEPNKNNPNPPFASSVVLSGQTTEIALATPSGIQSGIKLINQFDVGSGQRVDLLLDFDACKSIVTRNDGTYALKPVIKVIPFVLNGIEGVVDPSLFVNQLNVNHVVVTAQVNGAIERATVPNPQTGKFFLGRLDAPATYDVVITADGHATAVIAAVPVTTSTSITTISTTTAPFTLASSTSQSLNGTVTLNPADDDGRVLVVAKQTLNGVPTITAKFQVGTALSTMLPVGDYVYNFTLPIGAPLLGAFSTILPISLTAAAQSAVAAVYTVFGSAETTTTVYATQTPSPSPVNISGGATQNFTLTP